MKFLQGTGLLPTADELKPLTDVSRSRSPWRKSDAVRRRLDERPDGTVIFFPQGRIWPSFKRPLGFHPGIGLFARELAPMIVLPARQNGKPCSFASAAQASAVSRVRRSS